MVAPKTNHVADPMPKIKTIGSRACSVAWPARILFPPVCAGCRRHVSQPGVLCGACWPKLRLLERPWCPVMGTPFTHDMGEGFLSAEAIADPPPFERARAAVAYSGVARQMVQGLKYQDRTDLAPWMARWMVRAGADLDRRGRCGGAGAAALAALFQAAVQPVGGTGKGGLRAQRLPFAPSAIRRVKLTRQQVGLERQEREENVRGRLSRARRGGNRDRRPPGAV